MSAPILGRDPEPEVTRVTKKLLAMLVATLSLALAACGGGGDAAAPAATSPAPPPAPAAPAPAPAPAEPAPAAPAAPAEAPAPVRIRIPAIEVDAQIVPVGLQEDGAMETPDFGLAGVYTEGPNPGAAGPAVVVAHVDSRSGPDVFYRLKDLRPGDQISIDREDGSSATWAVTSGPEQTDKDELPADRILNDTQAPVLRLITCGGIFDRSIGHYEDNITIYADQQTA